MNAGHMIPNHNGLVTADTDDSAQALCGSCGMCCDGTLFAQVLIRDTDDLSALAAAGMQVGTSDESRRCPQPCAAHTGSSCRVYEARPSICRAFRCQLLIDLESRTVDLSRALALVRQALALKTAVRKALERIEPALVGASWFRLLKDWTSEDDPAASLALRRKYARVLVCMIPFERYLERYFRLD